MSDTTRPRLTVALTFDHDAIAAEVLRGDDPSRISRGEYGPRVGVPRILELLERRGIAATWFVPAHTARTFPESVAAIVAAGHELGCHGWAHEDLATLEPEAERRILEDSRAAIARAYGRSPLGFRAPYWSLSPRTLQMVEALGFAYDSSLMADDLHLYRVRHGDRHAPQGSVLGQEGRLVEVPISWLLDDWPQFEPGRSGIGPLAEPSKVLEIWTEELRWAHAHVQDGVLTVTMHPEAIGRGSRLTMLERFIDLAGGLEGVVFERLDRVVERWSAAG
ncbi:MAG TPA: polysaccharide deacetylase [Candidatus Limnocylindrales bacterium]|nr:polysaccharide deacetylase [Candidatus Limnocylindrales bacterium]